MNHNKRILNPDRWDLTSDLGGLRLHGNSLDELAEEFSTPLHVVNEPGLIRTAKAFREAVRSAYEGETEVHYPFKCNSVPGIVRIIREAGLKAEVMTEYEFEVARNSGFQPEEIIVNGPYKSPSFLKHCVTEGVQLIIIDSLLELDTLISLARSYQTHIRILLRIHPRFARWGASLLSGAGNRSSFGFDLWNGEIEEAFRLLISQSLVNFCGFHFHIGTGISDPKDFSRALECLPKLKQIARSARQRIEILDIGGGLASPTSREFTSLELILYQGISKLPKFKDRPGVGSFNAYAKQIAQSVNANFMPNERPKLLFEPGRSITSRNQLLLLRVTGKKVRSERETWVVCDGGLSTVTMPTYYEYHEVFPCVQPDRQRDKTVTLLGPGCFAADIIYRNKQMPDLEIGETLAIMDSGAYFTSLESTFGFPRPAIVAVNERSSRLLRSRETLKQMSMRDNTLDCFKDKSLVPEQIYYNNLEQ